MASLTMKTADGKERSVSLVKRITSLGRDPQNDVVLEGGTLPGTALHIHFDGRHFNAACDVGVDRLVNGKRKITCRLTQGDVIRVANVELAFSLADPTSRQSPSGEQSRELSAMASLVRFS